MYASIGMSAGWRRTARALALCLAASAPQAFAQSPPTAPTPQTAAAPRSAHADVPGRVKITMQAAFNPGVSVLGESAKQFARSLRAMSGGAVVVKILEAGARAPTVDLLDAVVRGDVEAAFTTPFYAASKAPALLLFAAVPFGPTEHEYVSWMIDGDGGKLHRGIYERLGVHALMCGVAGPEAGGWFRNEVTTVADLKGQRVRYVGLGGDVMARFGAEIVTVPAGELFHKLQEGRLDAAEFSMPSVDRAIGFEKLSMIYYFPGWHQPATVLDFYMRKDAWDALGPDRQAQIEIACRANIAWTLSRGPAEQARALDFFRKQGVSIRRWPASVLDAFRETSSDVLRERADKDPEFKLVLDNLRQFLDGPRAWSRLSRP